MLTNSEFATNSPAETINETTVQEFVADLKRSTFERRKPDGTLIKTYRLSRKTILNILGLVKLVLGLRVWMTWELDLGKPNRPKQPYFTQEQLRQILEAAPAPYSGLFAGWLVRACGSARRRDSIVTTWTWRTV